MKAIGLLFSFFLQLFAISILQAQCTGKPDVFITGGYRHTLTLKNRNVYTSGENYAGQLGNGKVGGNVNKLTLANANNDSKKFQLIDAGSGGHSLALGCDGFLYSWGRNNCGQLGDGKPTTCEDVDNVNQTSAIQVVGGETKNALLTNIVSIAGGDFSSYALLKSGEVVAWGSNKSGQLGNGTTVSTASPRYVLQSIENKTSNVSNIAAISAGDNYLLMLDKNGIVYSIGGNFERNSANDLYPHIVRNSDGTPLPKIKEIAAGDRFAMALSDDGKGEIYAWGYNDRGQLGQGNTTANPFPQKVKNSSGNANLSNVSAIAAGYAHALALLNGEVLSWGYNNTFEGKIGGQLGKGPTSTPELLPIAVQKADKTALKNINKLSIGDNVSFAFDESKVYGWGFNATGQLGLGHNNEVNYATELPLEELTAPKAGDDRSVCADTVHLNGMITGNGGQPGTFNWTTSGKGTFSDPNVLNPIYTRAANEVGVVKFTLNNSSPGGGTDDVDITFPPIVRAGADQTVCSAAELLVSVEGTVFPSNVTVGWASSSAGTFLPSNAVKSSYTVSATDKLNKKVKLYLSTSSNNSACPTIADTLLVTIADKPTVNAGADKSVCDNATTIQLKGESSSSPVKWTGPRQVGFANSAALETTYTLTPEEKNAGSIELTLTAEATTTCPAVPDKVVINFDKSPLFTTNFPTSLCKTQNSVNLTITPNPSTSAVTWNVSGSYTGTGASIAYTFTDAEKSAGKAIIGYSIKNGTCEVLGSNEITLATPPTITITAPTTVCAKSVNLSANISGGSWSASLADAGSFSPVSGQSTTFTLNSSSNPTALEFTYTGPASGSCPSTTKTATVEFKQAPTVEAGDNQKLCNPVSKVELAGGSSTQNATWSTLSKGTSTTNPFSIENNKVYYTPNDADKSAGSVKLVATVPASGSCAQVSDTVSLFFYDKPAVTSNVTRTICITKDTVHLRAIASPTNSTIKWLAATGKFINSLGQDITGPTGPDAIYKFATSTDPLKRDPVTISTLVENKDYAQCNTSISGSITSSAPPTATANPASACGATVNLDGQISAGTTAEWTTTTPGTYSPNNTTLKTSFTPTTLPTSPITLTLKAVPTSTNGCGPATSSIQVSFTPRPTIDLGGNKNVCSGSAVSLSATVSDGTLGDWSSVPAEGSFSSQSKSATTKFTLPQSSNLTTVDIKYAIPAKGNCPILSETIKLSFDKSIDFSAGPDQTICNTASTAQLNATLNSTTIVGKWKSTTGGTFSSVNNPSSPESDPKAVYRFTEAEKALSSIILKFEIPATASCPAQSKEMKITMLQAPVVKAGNDTTVCSSASSIIVKGTVTPTNSTFKWLGGNGGKWTNSTSLIATYEPSDADKSSGKAFLVLEAGATSCLKRDTMIVTFTPSPVITLATDTTICGIQNSISIKAKVSPSNTPIEWLGGQGTLTSRNVQNITYEFTSQDKTSGLVTLRLVSKNNSCNVEKAINIKLAPKPEVDAGPDLLKCTSVIITLEAKATSTPIWSGGGTFSNPSSKTTTYKPSDAEIKAGRADLKIKILASGTCPEVSDDLIIRLLQAPIVNAGPNQRICRNNAEVQLQGTVSNGDTYKWSTDFGGRFSNSLNLTTKYTPDLSQDDDTLLLILTSRSTVTGCSTDDSLNIILNPAPVVTAGPNQTICSNALEIQLDGKVTVTNAVGTAVSGTGTWTSSGNGVFSPSANVLNAKYLLSPTDRTAQILTFTLRSTDNGNCNAVSSTPLTVNIIPAPIVNAGSDQEQCKSTNSLNVTGTITGTVTTGRWSSLGSGTFVSPTSLSTQYNPSQADKDAGTAFLLLKSDIGSGCKEVIDTLKITFKDAPVVSAGPDVSVCSNNSVVKLTGSISSNIPGEWSRSGDGTFSNNDNTNLRGEYTPGTNDKSSKRVVLTLNSKSANGCNSSDEMVITLTDAPTITLAPDITICANQPQASLNATLSKPIGVQWSSAGIGEFSASTQPNTTYKAGASDIKAGQVVLTITTVADGVCLPVFKPVTLKISSGPEVNAGTNQSVCSNSSTINLNGSVTKGSTTGKWTTTAVGGSFNPSADVLTTSYSLPEAFTAASIEFILTSTNNGSCGVEDDTVTFTFSNSTGVDAGKDQELCSNLTSIQLSGVVSGDSPQGLWEGGLGTFSPERGTLNATYRPTEEEIASGSLILTLRSVSTNGCASSSDDVKITFLKIPEALAGSDKSVCANNASLSLEGSVKNATGGIWETSATGGQFMPNSSDLKATYKFTEADTKGSLTFKLTTLGNGNCEAASDEVVYTFTQPAVVNAGDDTTVCTSVNEIALLGTINENINVKWTTSNGTGRFTSESSLATTYIPSAADKAKGGITLTLSTISDGNCTVVSDVLTLNFVPGPTVNAGLNQSICSGKATVSLEGVGSNTSRVEWSTGISSFAQSLKATYQLSSEEQKQTKLAFYLEGLDANGCSARDTVEVAITNGPTINAGLDISMCANKTEVSLNATAPTGLSLLWSAPNGGTFETSETIEDPLYRPSQAEKATGKATLKLSARADDGCTSLDSVDVTFTDSPTVTLGNDLTICANNTSAPLAGTFTVAKGVLWTKTGDGTFSDANSATSTYSPGPNDIKTGRANLTLTTVENGNCDAASDNLEIIINPSPVLTVNADESVCKSIPIINLEGVLEGISQAKWTTNGEGNIAPSATSLNASYTPTAGDVAKGSLNFILTSLDHGLCEAVQDIYTVTFTNNAGVEAGVDQSVCRTNNNVRLIGKISGTNPSGKWRSLGMGEFNRPTEQSLDVQYIPNEADFTAGKVQLILDATDEGCAASSDTVDVTFIPEPTVTIGEDKTVCSNSENVPLNATIVNGEGGIWESSGTGFFGDQLAPNTTFTPSPADIAGGNITLTFTTTDNGNCPSATDDLTMSFILAPTLNAGNDTSICASSPSINLKGTMSAQANITWDSEGTGSFLNRNSLNPTYNLSDADVSAGRVNLILRLSESGSCSASADTIKINYTPAPLVTLGEDMAVCTNSTSIPIMGTLQNAQEGIWSSTGRGTFSNPSAVPTNYSPTADDKAAGSVTMTFTTTGNTSCEASTADITINFTPIPTLEAGEDVSVCSSNASVNLKGTLSSPSDIVWSSNGTGTFSPDNTSLNAIYKVSAADMSMGDITLTLSTKSVEGCEVVSDNLKVSVSNVIGQSPSIVTRSVTKTRDAESSNYINFQVLFPESMQEVLTIRRRSILPSSSDFIDVGTATVNDIKFTDNNLPNHDASYEYVISGKNICGEEIESVAHHTIKLTSVTTEIDTAFIITWNPYTNWPSGVESYEVYINKSGEGTTLYQKVGGGVNQVSYLGTRTSNPPCFIVKAKEKASNPQESWSNSTCVEFPKEGLSLDMIPNAISPNNDGKNDVWDIDNIEKYDNEVTIFNQWDNKVYYKRGYTNDFSGENLPDGQYYYLIKYDDFTQRGTLLIVR